MEPEPEIGGERLLAVDVGVRCGLARFSSLGRLEWYQARDLGHPGRVRRVVAALLREQPPLVEIILEGGGTLADIWQKEAERLAIPVTVIYAETWRPDLLLPREQTSSRSAKNAAHTLADTVIRTCGHRRATALRTDAAEAILVAWWAAGRRGWLPTGSAPQVNR